MSQIKEFFVRIQFPAPDATGRKGCAAIVGAPNASRAKEIALLPVKLGKYPEGSVILDLWSRVE